MKSVDFEYSQTVYSPKHLAGEKGKTRTLNIMDAQVLAEQGYGKILEKSKTESAGKPEPTKTEPGNETPKQTTKK